MGGDRRGADGVAILGALDDVWIPVTNFALRPFVGALPARPEMAPQTDEVALIVELPLRELLHDGAITDEMIARAGLDAAGRRSIAHEGQLVWGATARTLAMFASVLRASLTQRAGLGPAGSDLVPHRGQQLEQRGVVRRRGGHDADRRPAALRIPPRAAVQVA